MKNIEKNFSVLKSQLLFTENIAGKFTRTSFNRENPKRFILDYGLNLLKFMLNNGSIWPVVSMRPIRQAGLINEFSVHLFKLN